MEFHDLHFGIDLMHADRNRFLGITIYFECCIETRQNEGGIRKQNTLMCKYTIIILNSQIMLCK